MPVAVGKNRQTDWYERGMKLTGGLDEVCVCRLELGGVGAVMPLAMARLDLLSVWADERLFAQNALVEAAYLWVVVGRHEVAVGRVLARTTELVERAVAVAALCVLERDGRPADCGTRPGIGRRRSLTEGLLVLLLQLLLLVLV